MKRIATFVLALAFAPPALATCPREDAVALAKRADRTMTANPGAAIEMLAHASALDPSNARVHYELARAYLKKEDWKRAARSAARAAELAPTFANYRWLQGYALMHESKWAEAKSAFEAAIAADPRFADPHLDLATTLEHLDDDAGALAHYTTAIRLAPSRVEAYAPLADLYRRLGFLEQAAAVARAGLTWATSGPPRFWLATLAGAVAEERHAMTDAVDGYREARRACGECREHGEAIAFFNLGMALASSKRKADKAEALDELTTFNRVVCRGAAARDYADECVETQQVIRSLAPRAP